MKSERNVWVLSGSVLLTVTGLFTWIRVFPNHLRGLGASEAQVGLAFMFLSFANRLPAVFGGVIADRFGRKRLLVITTFLMAPLYLATGFMKTWVGAIATLSACYVVGALLWPALLSIISDSVPEERRGRAIGILETCFMIAITAGPFLGAAVMEAVGDFRRSMAILLAATGAGYLLAAILRAFFLSETHAPRERFSFKGADLGWLLFIAPVGVLVVATFLLSTDGPFFALYAKDVIGLDEIAINRANFFGGLLALGVALVGGRIVDRAGSARVLLGTFFVMFLCLLPFGWAWWKGVALTRTAYWLYVFIFAPGELFIIAYQKIQTTLAPREHRALHIGLMGTATGLFASFANLAGGALYRDSGPAAPFALGAACALAGSVMAGFLAWKLRGRRI